MSEPVFDDAEIRQRALRTDLSMVLAAPAGSGKTEVLTQRLLALLAVVDEPEDILAVTFTRKAAAEMRDRVIGALAGRTRSDHPQAAELRALAARALARSRERGWQLLEQPSRLRILTLDAFNLGIAAQMPLAGGGRTRLVVEDHPADLYRNAARGALAEGEVDRDMAADVALVFGRLDNRWEKVEALLASMLQRRAHWLVHVLPGGSESLAARTVDSLGRLVADEIAAGYKRLPPAILDAARRVPGAEAIGSTSASVSAWRALAQAVLTKAGDLRARAGDPHVKQLIADLQAHPDIVQMLEALRGLPDATMDADDAAFLDALGRLLDYAARQLQVEFLAAGRVDHTFIAGVARAALTEEGDPTDFALRAGLKLQHILVDEFQDTSIPQFQLLEALVAGWTPGDGRTFFAVGDPMQSIYLFRDAEVGLFLEAQARGFGGLPLESRLLSCNFRSRPALVDAVNASFAPLFPSEGNAQLGAVPFGRSVARRAAHDDTGLRVDIVAGGSKADESRLVVQRVRELRARSATESIGILLMSRAHAGPIWHGLEQAGFTVHGVKLVELADVPVVRDLTALLRALSHPGDRLAWLTVLRAPWIGARLATLDALSSRGDRATVWEALHDADRLAQCAPEERARLERVRPILANALAQCRRMPVQAWLEATWIALGGADAYGASALGSARVLLRALGAAAANGEWPEGAGLDRLIDGLYAEPGQTDKHAVQIMTLHNAKGLEFDHVILPGYARTLRPDEEPLLRWLDLPRAGGRDFLAVPFIARGDRKEHPLRAYVKSIDRRRRDHERVRLLYVAATRAKETLHVIAAVPITAGGAVQPKGNTPLRVWWPELSARYTSHDPQPAAGDGENRSTWSNIVRLPAGWQPRSVVSPAFAPPLAVADYAGLVPEFSWVGETARHVGTVVHAILERWGNEGAPPHTVDLAAWREPLRARLARLGVGHGDLDRAVALALEALTATLEDPQGRWLFDPAHRDGASELRLSGFVDGRLVNAAIDRTFIDRDGVRWVVDFKIGRHEGGDRDVFLAEEGERYRPQLHRYVQLASALGPEPVRAALYFPLLRALVGAGN